MMKTAWIWAGLALALTGCVNDIGDGQVTRTIEQNESRAFLQERLQKLSANVEVLQHRLDNYERELASVRARLDHAGATTTGAAAGEVELLKQRVTQIETAAVQQRQIILDEVARQLEAIARRGGVSPPRPSATGRAVERGYEHVVKSGETIAAIAKAYGVSANEIMRANNIKDARTLQVGQKLFIPQK